jgi:hypothetical protein
LGKEVIDGILGNPMALKVMPLAELIVALRAKLEELSGQLAVGLDESAMEGAIEVGKGIGQPAEQIIGDALEKERK